MNRSESTEATTVESEIREVCAGHEVAAAVRKFQWGAACPPRLLASCVQGSFWVVWELLCQPSQVRQDHSAENVEYSLLLLRLAGSVPSHDGGHCRRLLLPRKISSLALSCWEHAKESQVGHGLLLRRSRSAADTAASANQRGLAWTGLILVNLGLDA